MIRKLKKKAFTLVELLVVIAILAVLATVAIVGYGAFTKKAKESNDIYLVKQMNIVLEASEVLDGKNKTMTDALEDVFDKGYDLTKLTPTSEKYNIVWDSLNDRMVLLNEQREIVFPKEKMSANKDLYVIVSTKDEIENTYKDYSFYLRDNFNNNQEISLSISNGIDVGNNENIASISYANGTKHTVVIRTNGGTLNIDASQDTVNHFGWVKELNVQSVATSDCYHEYGFIGELKTFTSGKFVAYDGCEFHQTKEAVESVIGSNAKDLAKAKFGQHYYRNGKCIVEGCTVVDHEHVYVEESRTEATCKNDGSVQEKCTICGDIKTETLNKLPHTWDDGEVTKEATCLENGVKTYTCNVCDETKTEVIPKTGNHTFKYIDNNDGISHKKMCSICNAIFTANESHIYTNGKCICGAEENTIDLNKAVYVYTNNAYDIENNSLTYLDSKPSMTYSTLTEAVSQINNGDLIKLNSNVNENIFISKNVIMDLNGYTLSGVENAMKPVIEFGYGNYTFSLFDTSFEKNGKVSGGLGKDFYGNGSSTCGGGIFLNTSSTVVINLYCGTISNNSALNGGGIYIKGANAILNVYDCKVENNTGGNGSGIYVENGTFNMYGGSITNNHEGSYTYNLVGAGMYLKKAKCNITGAKISSNGSETFKDGGGIYSDYSSLTIKSGEIKNNLVNEHGGGIYIKGGTHSISNTIISNNEVISSSDKGQGGGIYATYSILKIEEGTEILNNKVSSKNNGTIDNPSASGAGIFYQSSETSLYLLLRGGKISNNNTLSSATTNSSYGGGIFISGTNRNGTDTIAYWNRNKCIINNNTASSGKQIRMWNAKIQYSGADDINWSNANDDFYALLQSGSNGGYASGWNCIVPGE